MKTLIKLMAFLAFIPFSGFAQNNPLDGMLAEYQGNQGFHFLDVNTNMMSKDISKTITLKLLSFNEKENPALDADNIYREFKKRFDKSQYKGLVEVKSSGENVEMMVKQNGENISEIVITVKGETETVLIAASGNFTMSDLAKFSDVQNCKGFQVLEKLCEE